VGQDEGHHPGRDHHGGFKPTKSPPPRKAGDLDCKKNAPCEIVVTVEVSGGACRAKVSHPVVWVPADNDDMDITWVLQAQAGYAFPPKDAPPGVFIKGPYDGQFQLKSSGATQYVLKNKGKHNGTVVYDYGVFVYDTRTQYLCDLLDPVIINEM
jgi:hypothetical protein